MKEIVLDTETTGISVKDGHRIVEIGCIELDNLVPTNNKFHCYLNPERKVSEKAFEVHGYSDEFLAKQKKFSEVVDRFLEFIAGKKIIIHNADFDLSHLNNELKILGKEISGETIFQEKINYFKKIIKPSNVELKKHKEFIKSQIKKNFFT